MTSFVTTRRGNLLSVISALFGGMREETVFITMRGEKDRIQSKQLPARITPSTISIPLVSAIKGV